MPSARDHPFNQSRRPLLECRPAGGGPLNTHNLSHDDEDDDDYADYEDIHNNVTANTATTCDFKTYGFVRKFAKAPAIASSSHNEIKARNNYNVGFNDFNAVPRANGTDVGYPYGEKIINEKQPIGGCGAGSFREPRDMDFLFTEQRKYLNNQQQQQPQQQQQQPQHSHYQTPGTLPRKLNNQHVNLYANHFNQQKVPNRTEPDFANRPLPQTPTSITDASPLLARQRPTVVCPTPPLCRDNRKGPFIFGVDGQHQQHSGTTTASSSPAGSPFHPRRRLPPPPVIDQWKYSETQNNNNSNCNSNNNKSPDLLHHRTINNDNTHNINSTGTGHTTAIRRRDVFQRTTQNTMQVREIICFNLN